MNFEYLSEDDIREQIELERRVAMLEDLSKKYMTKKAISRYGNLKLAHPKKALMLVAFISKMIERGKIREKIDDEMLKNILMRIR